MSTSELAFLNEGDINSGRGQFGISAISDITGGPITLWTSFPIKPRRYILKPTGSTQTIILPIIGTSETNAQEGSIIDVICDSTSSFQIIIQTSALVTITTLNAGDFISIIAFSSPATWITANSGISSGTTLQETYNNSSTGNITLDNGTQGELQISASSTDPIETLFKINNNGNTENYFIVKNTVSGPSIELFDSSASGNNSISIGNNITNNVDNSFIFGDSNITLSNSTISGFMLAQTAPFTIMGGPILPSIIGSEVADTSPNFQILHDTVDTTNNTNTPFPTNGTISTVTDTAYNIIAYICTSRTDGSAAANQNAFIEIIANFANDGGTVSINSSTKRRYRTGGLGINAFLNVSGTDLEIEVNGIGGADFTWNLTLFLMQYTWSA